MATDMLVNIGSSNGLLPDSAKPLPEAMLTHQQGPVTFRKIYLTHQSPKFA